MKKEYPVIEVPASGNPVWGGGAYVFCFVYSKYSGNFILKGYSKEVEDYLRKNYTHYFCNITFFPNKGRRNYWRFWKKFVYIYEPATGKYNKTNNKFRVSGYGEDGKEKIEMKFKRLPKRWIPEFDNL